MTATQLYDPGIIVFAGLVTVGMMIAIYGLTVSPGIGSDELATMVAYP